MQRASDGVEIIHSRAQLSHIAFFKKRTVARKNAYFIPRRSQTAFLSSIEGPSGRAAGGGGWSFKSVRASRGVVPRGGVVLAQAVRVQIQAELPQDLLPMGQISRCSISLMSSGRPKFNFAATVLRNAAQSASVAVGTRAHMPRVQAESPFSVAAHTSPMVGSGLHPLNCTSPIGTSSVASSSAFQHSARRRDILRA